MRSARTVVAFVWLLALPTGCRSKSPPPLATAETPLTAASLAPAAKPSVGSAADPLALLPDDPNWTRTERAVRVVSVTRCGKKSDEACLSFELKNETKETIAEVHDLRLFLYNAAGKKPDPQLYLSEHDISLEPGATRTLKVVRFGEYDAKSIASAATLQGEVTSVRFAGAPKGRVWYNYNLGDEERPKGGVSKARLAERAAVLVRALAIDAKGVAQLRNDGTERVTKLSVGVARWKRSSDGLRVRSACMSRTLPVDLAPGETRSISLLQDDGCILENFAAHEPEDVGTSVSVHFFETERGATFSNANLGYNQGWTRAAEDLASPPRN